MKPLRNLFEKSSLESILASAKGAGTDPKLAAAMREKVKMYSGLKKERPSSFYNLPGLQPRMESLRYLTTPWLSNEMAQSVYNAVISKDDIEIGYERESLVMQDGGTVSLDWLANAPHSDKVVFVMHGLTGGTQLNYMKAMIKAAGQYGYRAVGFNSRGINAPLTTPLPFTGHDFEDIKLAVARVRQRTSCRKLFLVGLSFGANILTRFLAQHPNFCDGYAGLSTPFDVEATVSAMPSYYQQFFAKLYIQKVIKRNMDLVRQNSSRYNYDVQKILNCNSLREYHSLYSCKLLGTDIDKLFGSFKVQPQQLQALVVPSLFLHAQDDNIVSWAQVPHQALRDNPKTSLLVTRRGAHLCWFEGSPPQRWYPKAVMTFFDFLCWH